jgi:hypothetical protein
LAIVAIPFRRRQPWARWACWAVMIANIGYAVTIAHYASALLRQSLIGVIVLPVALLISAPYLLRKSNLAENATGVTGRSPPE